ncbi:MAG: nitronate monooxygenase [Oscillospiraceae bacterium]|nr:nitronate monooxygenase [Oscillospiraceae bacterium]
MERKLNTRVTEMLGIERPILSGAMQWLAKAELVAAVSNAGGLGVMSSATFPNAEELRAEIRKCRELTDRPFAVNLTLMPSLAPPDYPSYIKVCIEEGIRIMETSGRAPEAFMPYFKSAGMTVIHKCTIVKHALKAQSIGCDAVIMDGMEAAGHVGENDIGSMVLWPAAVDALDIPVIACGGVGDGRGLAAALMLGCEGATVGTRFFLSEEAPALRKGKEMVAGMADEMSTTLVLRRFTNTTRVLNNGLAVKVAELERAGAPFEEIAPLASGRRLKKAFETGDLEDGVLTIGQVNGILHDILPVREIMDRMMEECFACLDRYAE